MNIRWKLILTIGTALIINLAVSYYAAYVYKQATVTAASISEQAFQVVVDSLSTQVHFKKQVQEWKNILLRGHEPGLYKTYLGQFHQEEQLTREKTSHLLSLLDPQSEAWSTANAFFQAHHRLGFQYMAALKSFDPARQGAQFRVDKLVRGIDREPTDLMDRVVRSTLIYKENRLKNIEENLQRVESRILLVVAGLLSLTVLVLVWLADRNIAKPITAATEVARRIAGGNLTGQIPVVKGNDEAVKLLQALQIMQKNLASSQSKLREERSLLAERVESRTLDLNIANAELARAAKTKDQFLATMSHELRTPMTTILGLTEMLKDQLYGPINEGQESSLATIDESSRHLLTLINDILDVAKVESGKMELKWDYLPIGQLVDASLRLVHQPAQKKNHTLKAQIDTQIKLIHCDGRRMKQLLVNLLGNAIKFTPNGGSIGLDISGHSETGTVHLSVWDTGIGIEKKQQDQLFAPFVQLDNEPTRRYSGTGLGLTLVRRMAELHGGSVSVKSTPGKGSRFTVTLPWSVQDNNVPHAVTNLDPDTTSEQEAFSPRGIKILLAEDDHANRMMIEEFLSLRGFDVITADNGRSAFDLAREEQPDLILMDVQLDELNGLEVTSHLRRLPMFANTPIIALTALAMHGDREKCLEAGMDDYLSKPVGLKEIYQRVLVHLRPR